MYLTTVKKKPEGETDQKKTKQNKKFTPGKTRMTRNVKGTGY